MTKFYKCLNQFEYSAVQWRLQSYDSLFIEKLVEGRNLVITPYDGATEEKYLDGLGFILFRLTV